MGKHSDTLKRLFDQWEGGKNDNLEEYLKLLSDDVEYDHFLHPTLAQVRATLIALDRYNWLLRMPC